MTCPKCAYTRSQAYLVKRRRERAVKGLVLRPYYCGRCGRWHLTSQEDKHRKGGSHAA